MAAILQQVVNGVWFGLVLFLIASGLTIILGILDILNLAHGELFALGAYLSTALVGAMIGLVAPPSGWGLAGLIFIVAVVAGLIVVGLVLVPVGGFIEAFLIRPIYDRPEEYQLLLTFGLLLIIRDVIAFIWGTRPLNLTAPYSGINQLGTTELIGFTYPTYNVFTMLIVLVSFVGIIYFFNRTKTGRIIRAMAINREMATAIGVNTDRMYMLVFALGAFFAGLAGAMILPTRATNIGMGDNPLVLSFVVIVIGGLGSIRGALVAALVVGIVSRLAISIAPALELAAPFAIMAGVLLLKPEGLFGTWGELE